MKQIELASLLYIAQQTKKSLRDILKQIKVQAFKY